MAVVYSGTVHGINAWYALASVPSRKVYSLIEMQSADGGVCLRYLFFTDDRAYRGRHRRAAVVVDGSRSRPYGFLKSAMADRHGFKIGASFLAPQSSMNEVIKGQSAR